MGYSTYTLQSPAQSKSVRSGAPFSVLTTGQAHGIARRRDRKGTIRRISWPPELY